MVQACQQEGQSGDVLCRSLLLAGHAVEGICEAIVQCFVGTGVLRITDVCILLQGGLTALSDVDCNKNHPMNFTA